MDLFYGLSERTYGSGRLYQRCEMCKWWQLGHRRELERCSSCRAPLPPAQGLEFGGLFVERRPAGFILHDVGDRSVRLDDADVPDALRFMAANWRNGVYGVLGEAGVLRTGKGGADSELRRFRFLDL